MLRPREQALKEGRTRYFTGRPCKHGHLADRNTKTRVCTACIAISAAAAYAKKAATNDPEWRKKRRADAAAWKAANPERVRANNRAWGKANLEKRRTTNKRWRQQNIEHVRKKGAQWRAQNRQKARQAVRDWEVRNPERAALMRKCIKITRRTREVGNGGSFTVADIEALYARQNGRCAVCPCTEGLEIDHILPVLLGGSSDPSNLQLLCLPCNRKKGSKHPDVWRAELAATLQPTLL